MKKWIVGLVLIVVIGGAAFLMFGRGAISGSASAATPPPAAAPVAAAKGVNSDASVVPVRSAKLALPAGGIVAEVLVAQGDQVEAGQLLMRVQSERQQAAVAQAEAGLARAQQGLAQAKAGARTQEIAAAQASVEAAEANVARIQQGSRSEDIAAAEAALAGAQAALQKVKEGPTESGIVAAQADLANATAALQVAQAAYDRVAGNPEVALLPQSLQLQQATNAYNAAKARLAIAQKGATQADINGAVAKVSQAKAQLDALRASARPADLAAAQAEVKRAQAQLDLLQAGSRPEAIAAAEADVASAEAALRQAKAALAETELVAPFAGTVATLSAKVGEQVGQGTPIAVLADFSKWEIETEDLTEINVVRLNVGDPAKVTFDAVPGLELSGKVVRIDPVGEKVMGDMTYKVTVAPDNGDPRLRWNMTASVEIGAE